MPTIMTGCVTGTSRQGPKDEVGGYVDLETGYIYEKGTGRYIRELSKAEFEKLRRQMKEAEIEEAARKAKEAERDARYREEEAQQEEQQEQ